MKPIQDLPPDVAPAPASVAEAHPALAAILDYLQHQLPGYPFQQRLDAPFVRELLDDFPDTDILEEVKNLRWYHDNRPLSGVKTARIALRRWVARAPPASAIADPFAGEPRPAGASEEESRALTRSRKRHP